MWFGRTDCPHILTPPSEFRSNNGMPSSSTLFFPCGSLRVATTLRRAEETCCDDACSLDKLPARPRVPIKCERRTQSLHLSTLLLRS